MASIKIGSNKFIGITYMKLILTLNLYLMLTINHNDTCSISSMVPLNFQKLRLFRKLSKQINSLLINQTCTNITNYI